MTHQDQVSDEELTFADFGKKAPGRRGVCAVCESSSAGSVKIVLEERKDGKQISVGSASKTLCEPHAVKLFQELKNVIATFVERGQ